MFMKKLLSGIIFLMIAAFGLTAANESNGISGVYSSTHMGYNIASGYGVNATLALGYQFERCIRLEAAGSFVEIENEKAVQVSAYALCDIFRYQIVFGTLGLGGGCAFVNGYNVPTISVPTAGCRVGLGCNITETFSISVEYDGSMFWFNRNGFPVYVNGFGVLFKVVF